VQNADHDARNTLPVEAAEHLLVLTFPVRRKKLAVLQVLTGPGCRSIAVKGSFPFIPTEVTPLAGSKEIL